MDLLDKIGMDVHEALVLERPDLGRVVAGWKLDTDQLSEALSCRVVHDHDEL